MSVEELVCEAVDRYLEDEARFRAAIRTGIDDADRGAFLSSDEVWARGERGLASR